jgi:MYXO-CTERM domain-containing protein
VVVAAAAPAAGAPAHRPTVIWPTDGASHPEPAAGGAVTRVLYLNRCAPGNCELRPGDNDSRVNTSSLAGQPLVIPAFTQSDETWQRVVACVAKTYAWFDIAVTDVDPGPDTQHFEVMFGGTAGSLLNDWIPWSAGGVSPGTCWVIPNSITFVFDVYGDNVESLCYVAAQESAHSLGLDHELLANDPLTYLAYTGHRDFQDQWADCGEYEPRECWCGGSQQNSFEHIMGIFGPAPPTPPEVTILEPAAGASVPFGFDVSAEYVDTLDVVRADLLIDGEVVVTDDEAPLALRANQVALHGVAPGTHQVTVRGTDALGATGETTIPVVIGAPCASPAQCAAGETCVGGACVLGPGSPGGLGEPCLVDTDCASGLCGDDGLDRGCYEECVLGTDMCPTGFSCEDKGHSTGVCWPDAAAGSYGYGGGGCATGSSPGGPLSLVLAGLLAAARRRRRRERVGTTAGA